MNDIYEAWLTFVMLYEMLVSWAQGFLPVPRAKRVVSRVISVAFRQACGAWPTPMGPWDFLVEQISYQILHEGLPYPEVVSGYPSHFAPIPTADDLHAICRLWGLVYAAKAHAQWNTVDIDEVAGLLRFAEPRTCSIDDLRQKAAVSVSTPPALRRAFSTLLSHDCPFTLICAITDDIMSEEQQKSDDWRRQHTPLEQ